MGSRQIVTAEVGVVDLEHHGATLYRQTTRPDLGDNPAATENWVLVYRDADGRVRGPIQLPWELEDLSEALAFAVECINSDALEGWAGDEPPPPWMLKEWRAIAKPTSSP